MPEVIRAFVPIITEGRISGEMPVVLSTQCATCKNWTEALRCKAFPDGIPEQIKSGDHDHRKPYRGDNEIRYEEI
jgi:hypothetical protein